MMSLHSLFRSPPAWCISCALVVMSASPLASAQQSPDPNAASRQREQAQREVMELLMGKQGAAAFRKAVPSAVNAASAGTPPAAGLQSHPLMQKVTATPVSANYGTKVQRVNASAYPISTARINTDGSISTACTIAHDHGAHGGNYGR